MWALLAVALGLLAPGSLGLTRDDFYTYGRGLDSQVVQGDDVASEEIMLKQPITFYGEKYGSIFVNTNGMLSFITEIPHFINAEFPLGYPVIAPFYANADTTTSGTVYYREAHDAYTLTKAEEDLKQCFPDDYDFQPTNVFVATWSDVGYRKGGTDKTNTFQVAVISNGTESYAVFLYPEDGIQWIQAKQQTSGLVDARAQVGITGEDGSSFVLSSSGKETVRMIASSSNCDSPGKYMYRIGNVRNFAEEPQLFINVVLENQSTLTCATGGSKLCHYRAHCVDRSQGFCCICNQDYYGNGKHCLKKDIPIRVNGKISSEINGELVEEMDLQAYVVMADGRTYTALSNVPERVGYSMQAMSALGGVIGWLFAKPVGNAKNGYQITGGIFNHTIELLFSETNEKISVHQQYLGLDLFDQLKMKADIKGSLPRIPAGAKLEMAEYTEQYTTPQPGRMISQASRVYRLMGLPTSYPFVITQTISYVSCPHMPTEDAYLEPMTLKVGKNFLGYETRERIIRYGMSNRIIPLGQEDPCIEGRKSCGPHSTCAVEDDSFKCVCNIGYHNLHTTSLQQMCIDINECAAGTHDCDENADCINQEGSYKCLCKPGFEGEGRQCTAVSPCQNYRCHPDANCHEDRGTPFCTCKEGFSGNGRNCEPISSDSCEVVDNCSPYADCINPGDGPWFCECKRGYEGDGYTCYDARATSERPEEKERVVDAVCVFSDCTCPRGYDLEGRFCYLREDAEATDYPPVTESREEIAYPLPYCFDDDCGCPMGFDYDRESHRCRVSPGVTMETKGPSGSDDDDLGCNVINRCHPYAQCVLDASTGAYECQCTAGFEGDGQSCTAMEASCDDENVCDPNASCEFDPGTGRSICVCDSGYQGNGHVCTSSQCRTDNDCKENAECTYSKNTSLNRRICECRPGYVIDYNNECVPIEDNCNGARCAEHATCAWDSEIEIHYCQCDAGYSGDGVQMCSEGAEAVQDCSSLDNCDLNAVCIFSPAENRHVCECTPGFDGDGYVCTAPQTCEQNPYMCSSQASCLPSIKGFVCECNAGYIGNGTVCKRVVKKEGNFLLVNQGVASLRIPFNPTPIDQPRPIQMMYYQMAVGLDVDCREGRVYWSDITGRQIKSSNFDGSMVETTFTQDIISPEGISVDWVSRNIYWTDSRRDTIEVANIDTKVRKVLFSKNLVDPRGIAAHPYKGKLFWSDWNRKNPKIEWSNMDGTDREVFLDNTEVTLPNSLAIDWDSDELCFADAGRKTIECVQIDTKERRTIAKDCSYPFGIAVTPSHYYWTDWQTQKVESVDKDTNTRQPSIETPLGGSDKKLYELAAVMDGCRQMSNICQYNNGQCPASDLCLLDGKGGRSCVCGKPFSGPSFCNN